MFLQLLAGDESSRANLAPKLIRIGLVALCLWWGYALWMAAGDMGVDRPKSLLNQDQLAQTALWIGIALLAWGLLRTYLTRSTPQTLPLVLTILLAGQACHEVAVKWLPTPKLLQLLADVEFAAWEWVVLGGMLALLVGSRFAAVFLFRRWPLLAIAFVLLHALPPLLIKEDSTVDANATEVQGISNASIAAKATDEAMGPEILSAPAAPLPSLALDLFSIALLFAFYRSRHATPSQEAPAP